MRSANGLGMRAFVGVVFVSCFVATPVRAASNPAWATTATVCPAKNRRTPPTFEGADCASMPYWRVNPQGREVWVRSVIELPPARRRDTVPMAVFVSAKAASEVFLNGQRIGQNGVPAATAAAEVPGLMDAVFYAPPSLVHTGANEVAIRMSSHHGFLRFGFPVHYIVIDEYADPTRILLTRYWPSLIPFGALLAGVLTFGAASVLTGWRKQDTLLALLSLLAAGQLFVEIYRGLVAYAYPVHEWRVLLVAGLSFGFGSCLAALVVWTFIARRRLRIFAGVVAATATSMLLMEGYDDKARVAVLLPALVGTGLAAWAVYRGLPQARIYLAGLATFVASSFVFAGLFLDAVFFFEVAALVVVLFVAQTSARELERAALAEERARSRQLAAALEAVSADASPVTVRISSAGAIEVVDAESIVFCKGAGDYVELYLSDGRTALCDRTLARLDDELPAGFLRVHRSYLVNTEFVRSLRRESSGTGVLVLKDGTEVPVSRRVMPKVRTALR